MKDLKKNINNMIIVLVSVYILGVLLSISCSNVRNKNEEFVLKKTDKSISLELPYDVKSSIMTMFLYSEDNTDYLTFQNPINNQIFFYNLASCKLEFKIEPEIEGPNGVAFVLGYYIHNFDSIYLTTRSFEDISLIDRKANLIDKFYYGKTLEGEELRRFYSTTSIYTPMVIIDNKMYIVSGCNRWGKNNPVSAYIDIVTKEVNALPFNYPSFSGADNKNKRAGIEEHMSRCFDGEKFIYSFYFDEDIYIYSIDHSSCNRVKVKSKYIDKVKCIDDYGKTSIEHSCEIPNYGNLLYDKFKDVYYRVAYPETYLEKDVKGYELREYGRKSFSIIIMDNKFKVIGETKFPDYTYNSRLMFVGEDGLYISDSHYLNPAFSDDVLSFKLFKLTKE